MCSAPPEAVAAVFGNATVTYRELNARANRLAGYLRGLGVGPDVLVGLSMERSLEMAVGVLGVLKAGAAYVPPYDHPEIVAGQATATLELLEQALAPLGLRRGEIPFYEPGLDRLVSGGLGSFLGFGLGDATEVAQGQVFTLPGALGTRGAAAGRGVGAHS